MKNRSPLEIATELASFGFQVFPVPIGQKSPTVRWKDWQTKPVDKMRSTWFGRRLESNYWILCGHLSGIRVLDIDSPEAERFWREVVGVGDLMDRTVCVKTANGFHYYFWIEHSNLAHGWALHTDQMSFDVRGEGGGVIAPPSIHETGAVYEWVRPPDGDKDHLGMVKAPDTLMSRDAIQEHLGEKKTVGGFNRRNRSLLSQLLKKPPPEGGRNDWLTKVAGHYAKVWRRQHDLYLVHVEQANGLLSAPLDGKELAKIADSIWATETEQHLERKATGAAGYLLGAGDRILTTVREGKGADAHADVAEWSDFDLRVSGVVAEDGAEEGDAIFDCVMTRAFDQAEIPVILPGATVGHGPSLVKWLAGYQVSIARPDNINPTGPPDHIRLLRYLVSQGAPRSRMVPTLGWDEESQGFLTNAGVIRADGSHKFDEVRPDPLLVRHGHISHSYGFEGGEDKARQVLREVLTYHETETVAVFGSWWAACLLKPQIQRIASLFPICAIEAPSGSGKTNGFFHLMVQLNGNTQGATQVTLAAGRDKMAAHKSGIVWVDDMNNLDRIEELLRAVTSSETVVKKSFDNTGNVNIPLVAPVVVSGEQLGLSTQKALIDRVVILRPGRPDNRVSLRGDYPQWDDIIALTAEYPLSAGGLSAVAGTLVSMALRESPKVLRRLFDARRALKSRTGRQAEKLAILFAGAYLLDRLVDPSLSDSVAGETETIVGAWANTDAAINDSAGEWDNRVTTEILPWALDNAGHPHTPRGKPAAWIQDDETLEGPTVWVNCMSLASVWADKQRGRVETRTDTQLAIQQQIERCQRVAEFKMFDVVRGRSRGGGRQQARYWALRGEVADAIIERSQR
jgi:hypothetical protein